MNFNRCNSQKAMVICFKFKEVFIKQDLMFMYSYIGFYVNYNLKTEF